MTDFDFTVADVKEELRAGDYIVGIISASLWAFAIFEIIAQVFG